MHPQATFAGQGGDLAGREANARGAGDVGDGDDPRPAGDGRANRFYQCRRRNGGYRHFHRYHFEAIAAGAHLPGIVVRRVVMAGDEDLVARFQVEAAHHQIGAFAGIAGERDFVRRDTQQMGNFAAQPILERDILFTILKGRIGVEVAEEVLVTVEHEARSGADIGRVQVDQRLIEREFALDELPVGFSAVSGFECLGIG